MTRSLLWLLAGVALTLLLQTAASGLGPIGVFLNLLVPLPVAFLCMRRGLLVGGAAVATAALVLTLLGGSQGLLAYLLQFSVASLLMPYLLLRHWAWDKAVAGTLLAALLLVGLALLATTTSKGISPASAISQYVSSEIDAALSLANSGGLSPEQLQQYRDTVTAMGMFLKQTLPSWVVSVFGAMLLLQVLLLNKFSRGNYFISGPGFDRWKVPELLVWPLIAAGFAVAFSHGITELIGLNLLVILLPVYFLQGLAVVTFFFQKKQVSPALRVLGYTVVALLNPMPMLVTAIGVFDMWADFRKPRVNKT